MEEQNRPNKVLNPNVIWIIALLVSAIVFLIAALLLNKVYHAERIISYLNYTSILLSILLSVFAILYTYSSSNKLDQQIARINIAVETIKTTNNQLSSSNQTLVQTIISMHEKLGNLEANQGKNYYDKSDHNSSIGSNYQGARPKPSSKVPNTEMTSTETVSSNKLEQTKTARESDT